MFDSKLRPYIDPPLNILAKKLVRMGISANALTAAGFLFAILTFISLSLQEYTLALGFIGLSRLMDGLDGPVARQSTYITAEGVVKSGETDLGGFLDIVSDFIFYSGAVFFFVVGRPEDAIWAAFLIFTFMGTASSFLAYAIVAAKRGKNHDRQGKKSFYYLGGLAEGSETIMFLVLICLFPDLFNWLAVTYGLICLLTTLGRVKMAINDFK